MLDRFYIAGPWRDDRLQVEGSEAHHLLHVLRKRAGDRIEVFDGQGRSAEAEVVAIGRSDAQVLVLAWPPAEPSPPSDSIWLAAAPPKRDRLHLMIEKLTEIGVDRIILLDAERTELSPREAKLEKLEQVAIAACKQCGRNTLPRIVAPRTPEDVVSEVKPLANLWLADQHGDRSAAILPNESTRTQCCFVGPEGGFAESEMQTLQAAGAKCVSFSRYTLRIETAAALAAGWMLSRKCAE
jgi:16S rRNA (uracil1498-N3)-methyltransferase